MARPTTKKDLLESAKTKYEELMNLINSMNEEDQEKEFTYDVSNKKEAHWKRDKNIRDILVHLYEWHQLLLNWVDNNSKGINKQFLLEPYNWKTYGQMNVEFFKQHQNTAYSDSKQMLDKSHNDVIKLIDGFSNEELFEKGKIAWTGTSTLGAYCVSATASHYEWALKKIKAHI